MKFDSGTKEEDQSVTKSQFVTKSKFVGEKNIVQILHIVSKKCLHLGNGQRSICLIFSRTIYMNNLSIND